MIEPGKKRWKIACAGLLPVAGALMLRMAIPGYRGDLDDFRASTKICDRNGQVLRVALGRDDVLCEPVPLARTGDWVVPAFVAAEDKRFFTHNGVDLLAVCRAALQNAVHGRIVSGASTLTTLVIKLTEPRRRTVWTKIVEAHHALRLEERMTKDEILEQYVNRAPFGANIRGIEAASERYFGKPSRNLSLAEAALLAGLPQSPSRLRPDRRLAKALERKNYVLERMLACGYVSQDQFKKARNQIVALNGKTPPFRAPHFCDYVLRRYSPAPELRTTLDMGLQEIAENMLRARLSDLSRYGIRGGAVVIVDVRAGCLRAMAGSPDFRDETASGQVNGATARRSPGSTLKPFVYAAAMEQGMCAPATMTADVPCAFPGYNPRNFNLDYAGPVSVRSALARSLNVPAVRCVREVGLEPFVRQLRDLGLSTLDRPAADYGLSIVVGTCETTLLDLANAYACLARGGVYLPLRCLEEEDRPRETRIYSEETAYMIADILGGEERSPDLVGHMADVPLPRMAWKTGTSSGFRDAWTIAYNPDYVVGVWIGNPDGRSSSRLVGGAVAAPIAGEIFRRIYPTGDSPWFERPQGLKTRQVCARSGLVPNDCCPATVLDYYLPGISPTDRCAVHRPAGPSADRSGEAPVREAWPPEIEAYLATHGMRATVPGNAADETRSPAAVTAPRITSPAHGGTFRLVGDVPFMRQEIRLAAIPGCPSADLYWFVDDALYCAAGADRPVFWPLKPGRHTINCSDASGNSDSVEVLVLLP